jgi:hypothetical protein
MVKDPSVARFLARHAVSVEKEVEADVAPWRDASPAERWRHFRSLASTLSGLESRPAAHRARVL